MKEEGSAAVRLGKLLGKGLLWVIGIFLFIGVSANVAPSVFPESRWAYGLKYSTDSSRVTIDPKPGDSDFLYSPVGDKGCHYKKIVSVILYSRDRTTNKPIVSDDGGRTWRRDEEIPDGGPIPMAIVIVTWEKAQEW